MRRRARFMDIILERRAKKKKRNTRTGSLLLKNINRDIRDQFKAFCAHRGTNMTEVLVSYMQDCIREDTDKNGVFRRDT